MLMYSRFRDVGGRCMPGSKHILITVIRENFVFFHFVQSDENILCENSLPVLTYTVNTWHALEVDENIVTRIF